MEINSNLKRLGKKNIMISKGKLPAQLLFDDLMTSRLPHSTAQIMRKSGIERVLNLNITPTDLRFMIFSENSKFRLESQVLESFYDVLRINGFEESDFLKSGLKVPATCIYSNEVYTKSGVFIPVGLIIPQFVGNSYLPVPLSKK